MSEAVVSFPHRNNSLGRFGAQAGSTVFPAVPSTIFRSTSTWSITSNRDYFWPWINYNPIRVDRLKAELTTGSGSGNFRMGLYAANINWQPIGAPLADSGDISLVTTGTKTYTPSTPIYLPPGRYVSILNSSQGVEFQYYEGASQIGFLTTSLENIVSMWEARTYAAFITNHPGWTNVNNSTLGANHLIVYRQA